MTNEVTPIDTTQLAGGDTVRAEFAPPARGWVEAEVVSTYQGQIQLRLRNEGGGSAAHDFATGRFTSITKVEPPIQSGDVVWFDGEAWEVGQAAAIYMLNGRAERHLDDIPGYAVWLVRDGKLNSVLAAGQ